MSDPVAWLAEFAPDVPLVGERAAHFHSHLPDTGPVRPRPALFPLARFVFAPHFWQVGIPAGFVHADVQAHCICFRA